MVGITSKIILASKETFIFYKGGWERWHLKIGPGESNWLPRGLPKNKGFLGTDGQ